MPAVPDISPEAAWQALRCDPKAVLVDVRTDAEWNFVGLPDLSEAAGRMVLIPWQVYPSMQVNAQFLELLAQAGVTQEERVYFLCRSGGRSMSAAIAAQAQGYGQVFNVADGFEGPVGPSRHRDVAGWKVAGLPWMQR